MAKKTGCRCPQGSHKIKTGRGRGWVCRSNTATKKASKFKPFVKAVGCR